MRCKGERSRRLQVSDLITDLVILYDLKKDIYVINQDRMLKGRSRGKQLIFEYVVLEGLCPIQDMRRTGVGWGEVVSNRVHKKKTGNLGEQSGI